MNITNGLVASFHYTLKNPAGEVLDSSEGNEPLAYLHGAHNIVPGLEAELEGKTVGDKISAVVTPEGGYGVKHDGLIQEVPRSAFGDQPVEPGMRFNAETDQGPRMVVITAVTDDTVTVDGNHPLAGETLHFDVEITDVREATPQEAEHGHVHAGGHDH